jgi:predicted SnoaL-like aldol condensation-catalyzing enzyme
MKTRLSLLAVLAVLFACVPAIAQEPVIGVTGAEADALFTSKNPTLNTNKQAAYHIMKDLLEANHWDLADKWLTAAYHQHNPNVASGRDGVVKFFMSIRKPSDIPEHITKTKIVAVVAEGDLVIVVTPREFKDPRDPSIPIQPRGSTCGDSWMARRTSIGTVRSSIPPLLPRPQSSLEAFRVPSDGLRAVIWRLRKRAPDSRQYSV